MSETPEYELLNVDFNNVHEPQQLQKIINQLKSLIEQKIMHINEITSTNDQELSQRQIILRKMNQKNLNNAKKIQQYKALIFTLNQEYSKFLKDSEDDQERQKRSIELMHQAEMTDISRKVQDLELQYQKLKQFQNQEAQYHSQIQTLTKELIAKQYQHNDSMNELEAAQVKQNQQLQNQLSQQISMTIKTAPTQAVTKLTSQIKLNQEQNIKLKQKLLTLQSQLQKLKKQRNQIVNRRKQLKINVTLNEDELEEYKAVGSLQKAKIKAYKDKLQTMKVMISEQVAKREKQLADRKKQRQAVLKTLKLKLFNLEKQKSDLKIKIQKVNLLAETILHQRAEVEEFFVMALDSCRKEVQNLEKCRSTTSQNQQKLYGQKVDIDELLPKDKQKILMNLYSKLAFGSK